MNGYPARRLQDTAASVRIWLEEKVNVPDLYQQTISHLGVDIQADQAKLRLEDIAMDLDDLYMIESQGSWDHVAKQQK